MNFPRGPGLFSYLLMWTLAPLGAGALILAGASALFLDRLAERQSVGRLALEQSRLNISQWDASPESIGALPGVPTGIEIRVLNPRERPEGLAIPLPPAASAALARGEAWKGVIKPLGKPTLAVFVTPLSSGRLLWFGQKVPSRSEFAGTLLGEMIWIALVVSVAVLGFIIWGLSRALSPVKNLARAMGRIAQGNLEVTLELGKTREFLEMEEAFGQMTKHLSHLMDEATLGRERLEGILSQTEECVAVLDGEGRLLYGNAPLRRTFNTGPERARAPFYWEVLRQSELGRELETFLTKRAVPGGGARHFRLTHEMRHYQGALAHLVKTRGALLTLTDITDAVDLSETKRQLVANVSHELNTPLTSIKGFVETLEVGEEDPQRRAQWAIVMRNTDRLIALVKDLLTLSQIEQSPLSQTREPVAIAPWLENLMALYRPRAEIKNLTLTLEVAPELPPLFADPFQLEQVGINLLENAVKYTEAGSVYVRAWKEQQTLCLAFEDTGIGIPQGMEERIFERFFVVDKSRTRTLGGTGLGLSIVKHIVLQHGGTISVGRQPQGGSKFEVRLPYPDGTF